MSNYLKNIIISAVILIGILFYYISFDGYYFYDDTTYMKYASEITNGTFKLSNDNFCHRFGLTVPLAIFYKLYGINDITSTLYSFLCWLGCIILCIKILKNNYLAITVAVIFCGLDYYHLFFNNKVYPDMPVAFFIMFSLYFLDKEFFSNNQKTKYNAFLFSTCFFLAFVSKTTAIYILPLYLILFVHNIYTKQRYLFWTYSIAAAIILFVLYFGFYYIQTGNPLYIFTSIENNHYTSDGSYYDKGPWIMFARLTYEPINMFIGCGMIIPIILGTKTNRKFEGQFLNISKDIFWQLSVWSVILMFWFGTLSFNFYHPMSLSPRMIIMLTPLIAVSAGLNLKSIITSQKSLLVYSILFSILSIYCYFYIQHSKSLIYIGLSITFIVTYFIKSVTYKQIIIICGFFISLSIQPIYSMSKPKIYAYKEENELFEEYLLQFKNQNITIVSDDRMVHGGSYFLKFTTPPNWEFIRFNDLNINTQKQNVYIIINEEYCNYLNEKINIDSSNIKLIINKNNKVKLYKLIKRKSLH